ncbi:siderophore-interacting protein [Chitinophaga horti]|uniref:Siderophore-interacting protein n=1 Tax=Chitinophaga horti TaxID=2920382 RepID=A0ABY6J7V5_9BACT|nr:siderophore-interacting protein [Chitinophaga horti]UYQ94657.1 siderophore-interacting protein [Chitinophaga horti]
MNLVKKAATTLIESAWGKTGRVLSVKSWEPATFFELEVHFPEMSMERWAVVQHLKVKVASGIYRDYTPARWDADRKICTLYVDAVHDGPGSRWVQGLRAGDEITYVGPGSAQHRPEKVTQYALGDLSSLGHFLALRQLSHNNAVHIAIEAKEPGHHDYLRALDVTPVLKGLTSWWRGQRQETGIVYVVGNMRDCISIRKEIKATGFNGRIKALGFWK